MDAKAMYRRCMKAYEELCALEPERYSEAFLRAQKRACKVLLEQGNTAALERFAIQTEQTVARKKNRRK